MRYKVLIYAQASAGPASSGAAMSSHSFYTRAQAVQYCTLLQESGLGAYLYDGEIFTAYLKT